MSPREIQKVIFWCIDINEAFSPSGPSVQKCSVPFVPPIYREEVARTMLSKYAMKLSNWTGMESGNIAFQRVPIQSVTIERHEVVKLISVGPRIPTEPMDIGTDSISVVPHILLASFIILSILTMVVAYV